MSRKVLIVDDDFDLRDTLAEVLQDEGFETATAANGVEALDYLRTHEPPGVILLDWMMPRMNGADFRKHQLEDPALAQIPVVLLTANARIEQMKAQIGVADFLAKPVKLNHLLEVLERYCGA